jgi:hypothetical protein
MLVSNKEYMRLTILLKCMNKEVLGLDLLAAGRIKSSSIDILDTQLSNDVKIYETVFAF